MYQLLYSMYTSIRISNILRYHHQFNKGELWRRKKKLLQRLQQQNGTIRRRSESLRDIDAVLIWIDVVPLEYISLNYGVTHMMSVGVWIREWGNGHVVMKWYTSVIFNDESNPGHILVGIAMAITPEEIQYQLWSTELRLL